MDITLKSKVKVNHALNLCFNFDCELFHFCIFIFSTMPGYCVQMITHISDQCHMNFESKVKVKYT